MVANILLKYFISTIYLTIDNYDSKIWEVHQIIYLFSQ
jgi:hypothetical protein